VREVFGKKRNRGIAVVDYLQIIIPDSKAGQDRRDMELGYMTRELKALARDLGIAIVLLSQLNRQNESRGGDPILSDLRESGSIEQDADMVIFPIRDDDGARWVCGKHRGGTTGKVRCRWDGPSVAYRDQYDVDEPEQQTELEGEENNGMR
jgi:replicative DNA helicase